MRIKKHEVSEKEWNNYIIVENKAHEELVKAGFTPQGCTQNFKQVVVSKEHGIGEHADFYYFDTWQEAYKNLCIKE